MRAIKAFLGLVLLSLPFTSGAWAQAAQPSDPVNVVKLVSFDCPVCRASELIDGPIKAQVTSGGGQFDFAPLPRGKNEAREDFYYAMRSLSPDTEQQVRTLLFSGSQDYGYPLMTAAETLDWLKSNLTSPSINWNPILTAVNNGTAHAAVLRAVGIAIQAGVTVVPTYILIRGNHILDTLDPNSVGGQLSSLRDAVLTALRKAQSAN